jgi:hypothetical protein
MAVIKPKTRWKPGRSIFTSQHVARDQGGTIVWQPRKNDLLRIDRLDTFTTNFKIRVNLEAPVNGKSEYVTTFFGTVDEVQAKLAELKLEKNTGTIVPPGKDTFGHILLSDWRPSKDRPSTSDSNDGGGEPAWGANWAKAADKTSGATSSQPSASGSPPRSTCVACRSGLITISVTRRTRPSRSATTW